MVTAMTERGITYFLTGLPSAGKSTIARIVARKMRWQWLDGDVVRNSPLSADVGFSRQDRIRHLRRVAYVAELLNRNGVNVICSFVAPYRSVRVQVKEISDCMFVYVKASPEACARRDPKGLWEKAKKGEITGFTGYDAKYETPFSPALILDTEQDTADGCAEIIVAHYEKHASKYPPRSLFIGRWQPLHKGHVAVIRQAMKEGRRPIVAIRDTIRDSENPLTAGERAELIRAEFGQMVDMIVIPDIESVNVGRTAGYEIRKIEVPDDVTRISGADIRNKLAANDDSWEKDVPADVAQRMRVLGIPARK